MSLVAFALRLITVKALRGATYAGARVYDSAMDPIDVAITEDRSPVVIVYTDEDEHHIDGKDIMGATRRLELVIETAVASRVEIDGEPAVVIPHTDAGMEAVLGFMGRQVMRALLAGPAPWSELWRQAVTKIERMTVRRGASAEKGIRFAARQMVVTCDTLAEPYFGAHVEAGGFWARLLAAMEADTEMQELARVLRSEIEAPNLTAQVAAAAALGITLDVAGGLGLGGVIPWGNGTNPADTAGPVTGGQFGVAAQLDDAETLADSLGAPSKALK